MAFKRRIAPSSRHQASSSPSRRPRLLYLLAVLVALALLAVGSYSHLHPPGRDEDDSDDSFSPPREGMSQQVTHFDRRQWLEQSFTHPVEASTYQVTAKPLLLSARGERVKAQEVTVLVPYLAYPQGVQLEMGEEERSYLANRIEALPGRQGSYLAFMGSTPAGGRILTRAYLSALSLSCPVIPTVYQTVRRGDRVAASVVATCVNPVRESLSHKSYSQMAEAKAGWEEAHLSSVPVDINSSYRVVEASTVVRYLSVDAAAPLRVAPGSPLAHVLESKQADVYLDTPQESSAS